MIGRANCHMATMAAAPSIFRFSWFVVCYFTFPIQSTQKLQETICYINEYVLRICLKIWGYECIKTDESKYGNSPSPPAGNELLHVARSGLRRVESACVNIHRHGHYTRVGPSPGGGDPLPILHSKLSAVQDPNARRMGGREKNKESVSQWLIQVFLGLHIHIFFLCISLGSHVNTDLTLDLFFCSSLPRTIFSYKLIIIYHIL